MPQVEVIDTERIATQTDWEVTGLGRTNIPGRHGRTTCPCGYTNDGVVLCLGGKLNLLV